MSMRAWFLGPLLAVAALQTVPTASAQGTTGRLIGIVRDTEGSVLSGVTVVIASPSQIGGPQTTRTRTDGTFSFSHLAPGAYDVRFELAGFQTAEFTAVAVALDRAAEVLPKLELGRLAESITVTTSPPVVDVTRAGMSSVYSGDYLDRASVGTQGRSYLAVVGRAANADVPFPIIPGEKRQIGVKGSAQAHPRRPALPIRPDPPSRAPHPPRLLRTGAVSVPSRPRQRARRGTRAPPPPGSSRPRRTPAASPCKM